MKLKIKLYVVSLICTASSCITYVQPSSPKEISDQPSLVSQGNQLARDGLLREAIDAYKRAISKEPNNLTAYRNLGIVLVKAGDTKSAIHNLEKSMTEYEDNFEANFYLAEAYRVEDKYSDAIFRYKMALKIQPDEPRALKSLAWSYYKIRFYSESIALAQKLQKNSPDDEQAPVILARVLIKLKRENEALSILKKGSEKVGPAVQPYYQSVIAEVLDAQGKQEEALLTWQKALKNQPMLAGALLGSGKLLLEMGRKKEASDFLERAIRLKPKMYDGHYWYARSIEDSNPERAIKYFNYFRKNASNDPEFLDLIQDAKKRTASLTSRMKFESN